MRQTLAIAAVAAVATLLLAGCSSSNSGTTTSTTTSAAPASSSGPTNPYPVPTASVKLVGDGATFPQPLLAAWGLQFHNEHSAVEASYPAPSGGSGKGISDITAKNVFFAGTDAPLNATQKANAPGILQFPETMGAVAVVYHIDGVGNGLKLDGETLGRIFTGAITKWNDPAIAALNGGTSLPATDVTIVYRSDSSGTSFVFTDYLSKASATFHDSGITGGKASKSPTWSKSTAKQLSGNGNDGIASNLKASTCNGCVGYVELTYLKSANLNAAQMKSHDGAFLAPTSDGASAAAASFVSSLPAPDGDWSAVSIVNAPGANSYPISSMTYMLVYQSHSTYDASKLSGQDPAQLQAAFKAWMWWCLHDGQQYSLALGYAPLPAEVVAVGEHALQMLN